MRLWLPLVLVSEALAFAEPLRLADVLARVMERGPEQASAAAQIDVARADEVLARMLPNPSFSVAGARTEPLVSAAVIQRLPIFGQRGAHVAAAAVGVRQAQAETELVRWQLRHAARVAYYTAARSDEEVLISVEVEALTRRVADMARERFEVGSGTQLEQQQAGLLHVRAQQDVSDRRAIARVARFELARLLGDGHDALGSLADALDTFGATPDLEALAEGARARHPALRALSLERDAALARARAARADRRPVPTAELGIDLLEPATCGGTSRCVAPRGAIGFDLPLLNLNGGPVARAEAEGRVVEARRRAGEVRIVAAVRAAYESWRAATVRARFFEGEYVPAAIVVERMAREGFAAGKTGILPLLEAERAVLEARLGRAAALFAVQAARADLEEASGVALSAP